MPPIEGGPRAFHKRFKFIVEFGGASAGFQSASEIAVETAVVEQREGGSLLPDKTPGLVTVDPVTLERGATADKDLFDWFSEVVDTASQLGLVDDQYKRTVDLSQLDRDGTVLRKWRLHAAWPSRFVAGAWDNTADENVIESVVLNYDRPELIQET
jgi:phage tail-like protein